MIDYQRDLQDRIHRGIDELKELTAIEISLLESNETEAANIVEEAIVELCVELDTLILIRGALYQVDFE